jgi:glycerol kinase
MTIIIFQLLLCADVNSSKMAEATALGAAFAAGLAVKFWSSPEDIHKIIAANGGHDVCPAKMDKASVEKLLARWKDAVPRSFNLSNC